MKRKQKHKIIQRLCPLCGAVATVKVIKAKISTEGDSRTDKTEYIGEGAEAKFKGFIACDGNCQYETVYSSTYDGAIKKAENLFCEVEERIRALKPDTENMHMVYPDPHDAVWKQIVLGYCPFIMEYASLASETELSFEIFFHGVGVFIVQDVLTWLKKHNSVEDMVKTTRTENYVGKALCDSATWDDYNVWADFSGSFERFGGMYSFITNVLATITQADFNHAMGWE